MSEVVCADVITYLPTIEESSVSLIIADPPYGSIVNETWDKVKDYAEFTEKWLIPCQRVLKDTGSICVWCSLGEKSSSLLDVAAVLKEYFIFRDMVVWAKQRGRGNRRGWLFTREEILWATKTSDYVWNKDSQYSTLKYDEGWIKRLKKESNPFKRATNVWTDIEEVSIEMARLSGGRGVRKSLHPTQKPEKAIERLVKAYTSEGDLVLDLFSGSGTTSAVCKRLNRRFVAVEQDESYCNIIKERLAGIN
jgi:site-specific DNA-methyltransferase (adenine-specific)